MIYDYINKEVKIILLDSKKDYYSPSPLILEGIILDVDDEYIKLKSNKNKIILINKKYVSYILIK